MDNIEFNNVEQVEELYLKLIEEYNEVATQFEELDALDDSIQELRCLNLDRYDFSLMSEVYSSIDDNYTANECIENMEECEQEIDEIREKVAGIDLKEHLFNLYNLEYRKEQYEIQLAACEKYLEKCSKFKEMKKKKALIKPASPKRTVEEKRAIRPASPRRSGGSYTPEKKEKVEDVPKLQALAPVSSIPKLQTLTSESNNSTPKPPTPPLPKPPTPTDIKTLVLPAPPKKTKKEKSEPKPLPVIALPELSSVETPAAVSELPTLPVVEAKKKGGRKKKTDE